MEPEREEEDRDKTKALEDKERRDMRRKSPAPLEVSSLSLVLSLLSLQSLVSRLFSLIHLETRQLVDDFSLALVHLHT